MLHNPSVLENHVVSSPQYNDFSQGSDALPLAKQVKTPAFFYTGWFDTFSQGTIEAFISRQEQGGEGAKGHQKLVIGPWTHYWPKSFKMGDFEVPEISPKVLHLTFPLSDGLITTSRNMITKWIKSLLLPILSWDHLTVLQAHPLAMYGAHQKNGPSLLLQPHSISTVKAN